MLLKNAIDSCTVLCHNAERKVRSSISIGWTAIKISKSHERRVTYNKGTICKRLYKDLTRSTKGKSRVVLLDLHIWLYGFSGVA